MTQHVDPTQLILADTLPPMAEWMCEAPIQISRSVLRALNTSTKETISEKVFGIRWKYRNFFERSLIRGLKQREYVVLSAILSRTMSYGKFAEEIPVSQFINGIRNAGTGELRLDEDGNPIFEGTGLDKNTIRHAVGNLSSMGLVTVFSIPTKGTKDTYAFSMVSLRTIYAATLEICPENADDIREAFGNGDLAMMAIFRDAAHELEERSGNLFSDGLAQLKEIQSRNAEGLKAKQRRFLADQARGKSSRPHPDKVKFSP